MVNNIPGSQVLYQSLNGFQRELNPLLQALIDRIAGILSRNTDNAGNVPFNRITAVQAQAGASVQETFVGSDGRSAYGSDGVTPQAPYPRLLNKWLVLATWGVIEAHERFIRRNTPDDIFTWLAAGTGSVPEYDAPHSWLDPNNRRLSDRIWRAEMATRANIDALLTDGIRQGKSAVRMARELEQFLLPGRKGIRTRKPSSGSYDAIRLARTEISHAHSEALFASSRANPFVTGIDLALSASHPRVDVCDPLASIGMNGERLREPYPIDDAPQAPIHPNCICGNRSAVTEDMNSVIERLRTDLLAGRQSGITPANGRGLLTALLGAALVNQVIRELQAV